MTSVKVLLLVTHMVETVLKELVDDIQTRGVMNCQTMHSGMIWHNVTDNFRLVAEGGYTEKTWYLADD